MDVIDLIVCARAAAHRLNGRYPAGAAGPGSGLAAPAMTDGVSAGGLPAAAPRNPETAPASCSAASRLAALPADQLRPQRSIRPQYGIKWIWLQSKFVSVSQRLRNSDRGRRRFPRPGLGRTGGRHSPGCTPVDPDDRLGRRAQWLREQ